MPLEKAFCQLEAKRWVGVSGQQSPPREQGVHLLPRMPSRASTTRGASVSSISQTLLKYKVSGQLIASAEVPKHQSPLGEWDYQAHFSWYYRGNSYNYMGFIRCNQIFS